jgi:drug/metabolite transporter (DMT)-like permease
MGAALLWASGATAGKDLITSGITPIQLVQARSLLSAIAIGAAIAVFRRPLFAVRPADLLRIALLGALALAGTQISYFSAIERIPVAAAILLQYQSVVLVFAFSATFLGERPSIAKVASVVIALGGCALVVGVFDPTLFADNLTGTAWGLAAAVCFAAYSLGSERMIRRYSPWTVLFYALLFSFGVCLAADPGAARAVVACGTGAQLQLLAVALLGTALPFGLFSMGIARIRATRASIVAVFEPVFAALLAFAFLEERLGAPQIAGGLAVIGAIALLQIDRGRAV